MNFYQKFYTKLLQKTGLYLTTEQPLWLQIFGATLIFSAATSILFYYDAVMHIQLFSLMLAATVFISFAYGFTFSIISAVAGALLIDYFFVAPLYQMFDTDSSYIRIIVYIFTSSLVSLLVASARAAITKGKQLSLQKDRLMAMVAHDLRNPISAVVILVELIEKDKSLSADIKDNLKAIQEAANLSLSIISDVQSFVTLESAEYNPKFTDVNLSLLIDEVISLMKPIAHKKSIQLNVSHCEKMIFLRADKLLLYRALQNLVDNAIKYSHSNTSVKIDLQAIGDNFSVTIKDNGLGISEEEQKNLFQPFYKTSNQPTAGESSTGLGLPSVAKIITLHKGHIDIQSRKGEGSTFIVVTKIRRIDSPPRSQCATKFI